MTSHSEHSGAMPTDEAKPNWSWMQEKLKPETAAQLGAWMELQLAELEDAFSACITEKSRSRWLRQEIVDDRR